MDYAVEIRDLAFRHRDGTVALRGVTLKIKKGSKTAILGPNGAGKSTLLLHLNGIYLPQQGTVKILGVEVNRKNEKRVRKMVGLVSQDPDDQVFSPTVWDDVAFGPANFGLSQDEIKNRVDEALKAVRMEEFAQRMPFHLSYGQRKRVAIAGVLAVKPEILVLDEPHAFLDPASKADLSGILERENREGRTVIVATHDVDFAYEWADEVVVIKDGAVQAQGGPEVLSREEVINRSGLEYPTIVRFFQKIPEIRLEKAPRNIDEAAECIRRFLKNSSPPVH
ncbi:ATP-binding cassette domain-containing protein [Thermosediminibacter litoriperuensis]|uniref:ABC transporter ATP-binding protein n=1 Tax=Thermosediminibacter litoriperuensis TaxID=291989 RepID=A0A5S5AWY5_9FIRM|nr:ATP-binding cassette domain-containing protein [Thermosediminibacter litoriperuensis]TYP57878.1 cobalt/nickel transport system ATP-binding protein [Thermosediminibacter litoriperuensis]